MVDLEHHQVSRNGEAASLTPLEVQLLQFLAERKGQIVTREALERAVWGFRAGVRTRAVAACVQRLRSKIEVDPAEPDHLQTVRGVGYRLLLDESPQDDDLLGRDREVEQLRAWLAKPGLVTVSGPPGVGKTRLARHLASLGEGLPSAVWFCELAQSKGVEGLCQAVARAGDIPLEFAHSMQCLGPEVRQRGAVLIVFDNAEHLVDDRAAIAELAQWAPEAHILTTSQSPWGLPAERLLRLAPLPPEVGAALLARRVTERGFHLDPTPDVVELAKRLDGLPLALELAAGRFGPWGVSDLLENLDHHLHQLKGVPQAANPRHATLHEAFDWSWALLTDVERTTLADLTVFPNQLHLDALDTVVATPPGIQAVEVVERLIDKSWIRAEQHHRSVRMVLLETVRWYATARRTANAKRNQQVRDRHVQFADTLSDVKRLEPRYLPDLEAAAYHALEQGNFEVARRLGVHASRSLQHVGPLEASARLLRRLRSLESTEDTAQVELLIQSAETHWSLGQVAEGDRCMNEAAELAQVTSSLPMVCTTRLALGFRKFDAGDLAGARTAATAGVDAARRAGSGDWEMLTLRLLGHVERVQGNPALARELFDKANHALPKEQRERMRTVLKADVAHVTWDLGRLAEADQHLGEVATYFRDRGDLAYELDALLPLAHLRLRLGQITRAEDALARARHLIAEIGVKGSTATYGHLTALRDHLKGRYPEAEAGFRRHVRRRKDQGRAIKVIAGLLDLGTHLFEVGRRSEALATAEEAQRRSTELAVAAYQSKSELLVGRILEDETALTRSYELAQALGDQHTASEALAYRGALRERHADEPGAERDLRRALDLIGEAGTALSRAFVVGTLACCHARRGEADQARHELQVAAQALTAVDVPHALARLDEQRARVAGWAGDRSAHQAAHRRALERCDALNLGPESPLVRRLNQR